MMRDINRDRERQKHKGTERKRQKKTSPAAKRSMGSQ